MQLLDELPDDIAELLAQEEAQRIVRLESFSQMVARKRDEAVTGRAGSGVELTWTEDEDHYLGIDNANRSSNGWQTKPMHPSAGFTPAISNAFRPDWTAPVVAMLSCSPI